MQHMVRRIICLATVATAGVVLGTDYYLIGGDAIDQSSLSGTSSAGGWATTPGGALSARGMTAGNAYFVAANAASSLRTPKDNIDYATVAPLTVEQGAILTVNLKLAGNKKLTLNDFALEKGATTIFSTSTDSMTHTLAGNWTCAEDSVIVLPCSAASSADVRQLILGATLTGTGTIRACPSSENAAASTRVNKITGDLSGWTGDIEVYGGFGKSLFTLELVNAASVPADTAEARVTVTNGAILKVDADWTSPVTRTWDFGSAGNVPTINVAAGKTVTIQGSVFGSVGLNKTGDGTLTLAASGPDPITVTGAGSVDAETLAAYAEASQANFSVAPIDPVVYAGSACCPKPTVTDANGVVQTENEGYRLSYANNEAAGEASVIVTGDGELHGVRKVNFTILASAFDIAPIPPLDCSTGFGRAPSGLTVTNRYTGARLSEGVDYTVSATDNDGIGTATAIVTGQGEYAYQVATAPFTITATRLDDENISTDDASVRMTMVDGRYVYTFTNAAAAVSVTAKRGLDLKGYLLVGGGGAGGNTMGGGGGGGGVTNASGLVAVVAAKDETFTVQVGKGGTKGGTNQEAGKNGDPTKVSFGGNEFSVIGGGGGGGWGATAGKTGGSGGGGAQTAAGGAGTEGLGFAGAKGGGNSASGGGGGAGGAGLTAANSRAGQGGPGVTNSITGVARCYAGGGGGGGSSSGFNTYNFGYGGTGGGGDGGKGTAGSPGLAGTGGGGGGGGWTGGNQYGGAGGSGCAVLVVVPSDFDIEPIEPQYVADGGAKPALVVRDPASMDLLVEGEEADYVVEYSGNTSPGLGRVTVYGRGDYAGKVAYATFEVAMLYRVAPEVLVEGTGLRWDSPMSLTNALTLAQAKDLVCLKAGTYPIAATLPKITRAITVRGGYSGEVGTLDVVQDAVSTITATGKAITVMSVENGAGVTVRLENLDLARGSRGLVKTGAGDLELYGCGIRNNRASAADGVGMHLTGTTAAHLVLSNCVIAGNNDTSSAMKTGQGAYITTFGSVTMEDTLFVTNGIDWTVNGFWSSGRDSGTAAALYLNAAPATFRRCRFVGNRSRGYSGGGAVVTLVGNDDGTLFDHCAFYGNDETYTWSDDASPAGNASGGMIYMSLGSALQTVTVRNCTIAYNHTDNVSAPAGVNVNVGKVVIENSVIANNIRCAKSSFAADLYLRGASAYADVRNSLFSSDSADSINFAAAAAENITFDGVRYGDPLFVTTNEAVKKLVVKWGNNHERFSLASVTNLLAIDLHVLSQEGYVANGAPDDWLVADVNSPAIDAGRADADVGEEPSPNGGVVNAGVWGGTAEASKTVAGDPAVEPGSLEIVWNRLPESYPTVTFAVGGSGVFSGTAVISITTNGTDWCHVSAPQYGLKIGDTVTYDVPIPLFPGTVRAKVVLSGAGNTHDYLSDEVSVQGQMPAWWSAKGPDNVIHVWADAPGDADGSSWRRAVHDLTAAMGLLTAERNEIWLAGDFALSGSSPTFKPSVAFTLRGGFTAAESEAAARPTGAKTTVNGKFLGTCFALENTRTAVVERVAFNGGTRGFVKTGAGYLGLFDCEFADNRTGSANGIGVSITGGSGTHVVVSNCVIRNNTGSSTSIGTGQGMYVSSVPNLEIVDTQFLRNGIAWTDADFWNNGRDGQYASALHLTGTRFVLRNCRFSANRGSCYSNRGSTVRVNGGCNGSLFDHCLWVGNEEDYHWFDNANPEGGNYSGAVSVELSNVTDEVGFKNCTIAYNHTGNKLSGAGITVIKGKAVISNSIIANNVRGETCQVGADLCLLNANAFADVAYSMFTTNDPVSVSTVVEGNLDLQGGIVYGDPLFVTPYGDVKALIVGIGNSPKINKRFSSAKLAEVLAIDVHLLSSEGYVTNGAPTNVWCTASEGVLSPAIDGGDTADAFGLEPTPNGGVINMGVYGNTAEASKTPYGEPQVDGDITVTWDELPDSRPTVRFKVGGIGAFTASAQVWLYDEGGNLLYTSQSIDGLAYGDAVVCPVNLCFAPGTFKVKVRITGAGQTNEYMTDPVEVQGELPPWWNAKGPDNVIHVRPGAYGANDGTSWRDAFSSFRAAFAVVASNKTEIWVAGTSVLATGAATLTTAYPTWVRGGFRGWETAEAERPAGARSTVDGANVTDCLTVNNATNMVIERMVFTRGQNRGLGKSGAGDLAVESCLFVTNGSTQNAGGNGKGSSVSGSADTVVTFRNCLFRANRLSSQSSGSSGEGDGIYASAIRTLRLESCDFLDNGTPLLQPNVGSSSDGTSGGASGTAICSSAPVSAVGCRFINNRGNVRYDNSDGLGGTVRLTGAAGGSAFTNCLWACNADRIVWSGYSTPSNTSGALLVMLSAANGTVDVDNCTFAYNLADGHAVSAGLYVHTGDVRVHNSIFHANRVGATSSVRGADAWVRNDSKLTVDHSMFDADGADNFTVADTATANFLEGVVFGHPCFVTEDATITNLIRKSGSYINYDWGSPAATSAKLESVNVHLRGGSGYVDETTGEKVTAYAKSKWTSPAIDAGDPSVRCTEPKPNGHRVNMGFYGNTPWATMSPGGTVLMVR